MISRLLSVLALLLALVVTAPAYAAKSERPLKKRADGKSRYFKQLIGVRRVDARYAKPQNSKTVDVSDKIVEIEGRKIHGRILSKKNAKDRAGKGKALSLRKSNQIREVRIVKIDAKAKGR